MAARLIVAGKFPMMRGWTGRESCQCADCMFPLPFLRPLARVRFHAPICPFEGAAIGRVP